MTFFSDASAQVAVSCLTTNYGKPSSTDLLMPPSVAAAWLKRIGELMDFHEPVEVVPCHYAGGVEAYSNVDNPAFPKGHYVVYDDKWLKSTMYNDQSELMSVFAHEIGHLQHKDFAAPRDADGFRPQREMEADMAAGCAMAKLRMPFDGLQRVLQKMRPLLVTDGKYFPAEPSIAAAKKNYGECEGLAPPALSPRETAAYALTQISSQNWSSTNSLEITHLLLVNTTVEGLSEAALSIPRAQLVMGWIYAAGELVQRSRATALTLYQKAAAANDARALNIMGGLYEDGTGGVQKNMKTALNFYKASSEAGNAYGQFNYGRLLFDPPLAPGGGLIVGRNEDAAIELFKKAARQGHLSSRLKLTGLGITAY